MDPRPLSERPIETATPEPSVTLTVASKNTVLLPTIQVLVKKNTGNYTPIRALLDHCSQLTFILRTSLPQLGTSSCGKEKLQLQGITVSVDSLECEVVELSYQYGRLRTLKAILIDGLPAYRPSGDLSKAVCTLRSRGYKLVDPQED